MLILKQCRAGFDKGVVLEHDPHRLRHARKLLHAVLQPRQLPEYRGEMVHHIDVMLRNFLQDPEDFVQHIRQYVPPPLALRGPRQNEIVN